MWLESRSNIPSLTFLVLCVAVTLALCLACSLADVISRRGFGSAPASHVLRWKMYVVALQQVVLLVSFDTCVIGRFAVCATCRSWTCLRTDSHIKPTSRAPY
jgi:hypothetical protein